MAEALLRRRVTDRQEEGGLAAGRRRGDRPERPAAAGFRIFHKLLLIGVLANIPVFLIGSMFFAASLSGIRETEIEREGIRYLERVWPVFEAALTHPAPVAYIGRFPEAAGRYDPLLGTVEQQEAIRSLAEAGQPTSVRAGVDLLRRISDNSRLSADPDVGTLQAILVVTRDLPEAAGAAFRAEVALASEASAADRSAALGLARHVFAQMSENLGSTDALHFNSAIAEQLIGAQMRMNRAAAAFSQTAGDALAAGRTGAETAGLIGAAHDELQSAIVGFGTVATAALGQLLDNRAGALRREVWLDIGLAATLLLLVTGLISILSRSITGRLAALGGAMQRMRTGDLAAEVPHIRSRDEVGAMARAVEVFRKGLIEKRAADEAIRLQNETLRAQQAELTTQNARFDAALNNMSHGLAMFDRDGRLIVCNSRYAEIYRLPEALTRTGTPEADIITHGVREGLLPEEMSPAALAALIGAEAARGQPGVSLDLPDGRVLFVCRRPMQSGGWVSTHEDITERQRAEAQIAHMAHHDALTRLPNRVLFREKTEQALARRPEGRWVAMLCLDLDHFKDVNDALGHPVGDALLQEAAERLAAAIDDTALVARLSGDEFAIVETGIARPEDAATLAQRIVEVIGDPYQIDGHQLIVGASVGIAIAPTDGEDADVLLKSADLALYRAKADGRGTHRFFETEMDRKLQARRQLEQDLREAIAGDQFTLFYQPLVNLRTGAVACMEALVRWRHPRRGLLAPADFIELAENSGQIIQVGEWVLRRATADAAGWPDEVKVAVNLSPVQFRNKNLVGAVTDAIRVSGLDPTRLELEITESVLLQSTEATLETLHQLRDLGVRIAMDDFGTGYSSLSYLRSFPFDKIKIDRSFTHDLSSNNQSMAIIRAVAGLGRSLGIATTAEGVETARQLELLRAEGCTEVQGYLFGQPRPLAELAELLDGSRGEERQAGAA